jgi:hypothetical protein
MNARTGHDPSGFIRKFIHISITDHFRDKISIRLKQERITKRHFTGKKRALCCQNDPNKALLCEPLAPKLRRLYCEYRKSGFILMYIVCNVSQVTLFDSNSVSLVIQVEGEEVCISLICDKSVTTQNLAFWGYWYKKKRLQMHF